MAWFIGHIWWVLGGVAVLAILAGWFVLISGSFQRLRDFTSPNSDKFIRAKLFCEDKQIRDRKLRVGTYCITDEKKMAAYYLVHDLLMSGVKNGMQFLCLNERDAFPIDFLGKFKPEKRELYPTAQRVYIDTANDIDNRATSEAARNFMGMSLSIIAIVGALVFVVMAIIVFWKTRAG